MTEPLILDVTDRSRFEIHVDGTLAGFVDYRAEPGEITFTHTEVDSRYEGQGLGGKLARFVLDDARGRGLAVYPVCPFIRGWIEKHPDYLDLVPVAARARYDL
jgi:predicted GNAT family acetyltransferase